MSVIYAHSLFASMIRAGGMIYYFYTYGFVASLLYDTERLSGVIALVMKPILHVGFNILHTGMLLFNNVS